VTAATGVTVELFGMPRLRAGRAELAVEARTVAEALAAIELACPGLRGLLRGARLAPHYLLSVNGVKFVEDLASPLKPGDRLLVLSADAGG
jgi:molybdopterin converting factor small subunit